MNNGRSITVKYATETSLSRRTYLGPNTQESSVEAITKANVPAKATIAILTETEHPSKKDSYPHDTTLYQDKNGKHITTKHFYPQ